MATLHVEHAITDYATWKATFDRFEQKRKEGGVTAYRINQPQDDPAYIMVELDFASVEQARAYQSFLETQVWANTANSPALVGKPQARVLVPGPAH